MQLSAPMCLVTVALWVQTPHATLLPDYHSPSTAPVIMRWPAVPPLQPWRPVFPVFTEFQPPPALPVHPINRQLVRPPCDCALFRILGEPLLLLWAPLCPQEPPKCGVCTIALCTIAVLFGCGLLPACLHVWCRSCNHKSAATTFCPCDPTLFPTPKPAHKQAS